MPMDADLSAANAHLYLTMLCLVARQSRLEKTTTRMSRHYSRIAHTVALIHLVEELQGLVQQDPDMWDDEPDLVPF